MNWPQTIGDADNLRGTVVSSRRGQAPGVEAWIWRPDSCHVVHDWPEVAAGWQDTESRFWVDLESPTRETIDHFGNIFGFGEAVRNDCLHGPRRPRIDEYDDYLVLFFFGIVSADASGRFSPRRVMIVCGTRFLVTVHDVPVPSLRSLSDRCRKHGPKLFERGVDVLLYRLVDAMVDRYLDLLDQYDDAVNDVELAALDAAGEVVLRDSTQMRRELMEVRRLAAAQRGLLAPVVRGEFDYVSDSLSAEFWHIQEHLAHTVDRVDALRERVAGAVGNYHTTLAKHTNDIMRVLTVSAALVLPLTLIAGIYGMNLPLWPPPDEPWSFGAVLGLMAVTSGGLLWFFRTREWF